MNNFTDFALEQGFFIRVGEQLTMNPSCPISRDQMIDRWKQYQKAGKQKKPKRFG